MVPSGKVVPLGSATLSDRRPATTNGTGRGQLTAGVETQFTRTVMVDLYVVRQDDSSASVERLYALGLALNLTY